MGPDRPTLTNSRKRTCDASGNDSTVACASAIGWRARIRSSANDSAAVDRAVESRLASRQIASKGGTRSGAAGPSCSIHLPIDRRCSASKASASGAAIIFQEAIAVGSSAANAQAMRSRALGSTDSSNKALRRSSTPACRGCAARASPITLTSSGPAPGRRSNRISGACFAWRFAEEQDLGHLSFVRRRRVGLLETFQRSTQRHCQKRRPREVSAEGFRSRP